MKIAPSVAREGLSSVVSRLRDMRADALVATSPDNVFYLTRSYIATQRMIRERIAAVIVLPDAEPTMIVCNVEEGFVRSTATLDDVRSYVEFSESPISLIAQVLRERGIGRGHVLLELNHLTFQEVSELTAALPQISYEDGHSLLDQARATKSEAEVEILRSAAVATSQAMAAAFGLSRLNEPSRSVLEHFSSNLLHLGADRVVFSSLGQDDGDSGGPLYGGPEGRSLVPGAVVRIDCSGLFGGYLSDLARMAAVVLVPPAVREVYEQLIEIRHALIAAIRPGMPVAAVYERCAQEFRGRDLPFVMPHIGHGLGIGYHEHPIIQPQATEVLRPNMVLAIEPIAIVPGVGGFHIEDTLLITDSGAEMLSTNGEELSIIG